MNKVINTILSALLALFLAFAWARYLTHDNAASVLAAVAIAAATAYICAYLTDRKQTKTQKTKQSKKKSDTLTDRLMFEADNAALFAPMLTYYGYAVTTSSNDYIVANKNDTNYYVAINFVADKLSVADLAASIVAAKRADCDKLIVFCSKVSPNVNAAADKFDYKVFNAEQTLQLFVTADKLPQLSEKPPRRNGIVASYALSKGRFGWYFGGAIWMVAISFLSYFKVYSLLWATALFALAMYSLLNRRYNLPTTQNLLD